MSVLGRLYNFGRWQTTRKGGVMLWTDEELAEARELAAACDADDAKWRFGDWLLGVVPIGKPHGTRKGTPTKDALESLAAQIDCSYGSLRQHRRTAHAWPSEYRMTFASHSGHRVFVKGGPGGAAKRRDLVEGLPRDRWGKVTVNQILEVQGANPYHPRNTTVRLAPSVYAEIKRLAEGSDRSIRETADVLISETLLARVAQSEPKRVFQRLRRAA